jgi:parallel beta-helix repeat protein
MGIHLRGSTNSTILENTIDHNSNYGISLENSGWSTVSGNNVSYNRDYGIYLENTENSVVNWNNFIGNNPSGTSQGFDDGKDNAFMYNYWNEWTETDGNQDGVVDQPYPIDGSANSQDMFPRTTPSAKPVDPSLVHIIPAVVLVVGILGGLGISLLIRKRA